MNPASIDEFFEGQPDSRSLFDALARAAESLGPVDYVVSRSQIAFTIPVDEQPAAQAKSGRIFARVWMPDSYLGVGHAPLVLTLGFLSRDASPRWKEIVESAPGRFTHHLEITSDSEIDAEVLGWLAEARRDVPNRPPTMKP